MAATESSFGLAVQLAVLLIIVLADGTVGQRRKLDILPLQSTQRNPVGKPLMLTCRPDVPDLNLITDLQWRDNLNMTVLPKSSGQVIPPMYTESLPGDQSLALLFTALTESMAGVYMCTASYANSEFLFNSVTIETYVAVTWKDAPLNQYPILGSDYTVRCEVTANPPPKVDWLRNGDTISTGGRYVIETHGIRILDVQESDDGIYTCRAAVVQTGELVERNIRVEVQIKPKVYELPYEVEAVEGHAFSIYCNASGKPYPKFTWVRALDQQNLVDEDRFVINEITGQMNILRVIKEDYGSYKCIAKNTAGVDESQMLLNVLVVPKIHELINITVGVDEERFITCKATGRPAPYITFRRWASQEELVPGPQPNDDRLVLEQVFNEELGEASGTLRIIKAVRSDDGLYECLARNKGDTAYKVGHIAVEYAPNFDHMKGLPPVYSWEQRRANLSCLAQGIPNATIEWRFNERLIKDLYDRNFEIQTQGPRSDLLITPIAQKYYTVYRCIAANRMGRAEHLMELRQGMIPTMIPQAIPKQVTATTILFEILPPPTDPGMNITAYYVQYLNERDRDWNNAFNRTWSPDSPYIVEGLRPQTSYNFRFAARNLVGVGPWGAYKLQATPKRSAPEAPRLLHSPIEDNSEDGSEPIVVSPYADHFELRWAVPADNGELLDFYQIHYCPGVKVNGAFNEYADYCKTQEVRALEATHYDMDGLNAGTYYRIELRAHNAMGLSQPRTLLLKTARGADVVLRVDSAMLSTGAIVGITIGVVLIVIFIIDLMCCCIKRTGMLAAVTRKTKRSPSDLDEHAKLGREEAAPLNAPMLAEPYKSPSTVDFDGRVVHSRSGEVIGKNSAV